ncbi:MAG: SDR family oxidoreductase [Bacteroidota bacterium]
MSVKSILIGSNGYLGRNLAWYLRQQGDEVLCYGRELDIADQQAVAQIDTRVDFIFLFAGLTGNAQGFEDFNSYVDVNEKGLLNLLTVMRQQKSEARLVFPSSRLVYQGNKGVSLKEDAEKAAKTLYALNKLACEQILAMYRNAFGINYTIFRIGVPYGNLLEGGLSYGTIGFFLQKAMAGENIALFGDGSLRRTFTHAGDICDQIYAAINKEESNGQIYNIGGEDLSLLDVAELISAKYKVKVEFTDWPEMALKIESGDTIFDGSELERITGSSYKHTIRDWLASS